jgi:Peptidase_C39 like family
MLKTNQKVRKQISDLKMDVEIVNPIESKTIMGGDWYDHDLGWLNITITGGGGGTDFGTFWGNYNDGSTWGNQGGDYSGGGGPGEPIQTYPDHICKQPANSATCATIALSYVANYFGATGLTSSDFAEVVGQNYDAMHYGIGGLTGPNISTIMTNFFQSTQISTYGEIASNVNSGTPVLATINVGTSGNIIIGHEVVITSLNTSTGEMTYMDSMVGASVNTNLLTSVTPISFIGGSIYAVTGVQNNATVNQYKNDTNDVSHCSICGH